MQSQLQWSFQRVEQALQRLTDSIAAYNPDVRAAEELQAADEAVSEDLKKRAQSKDMAKEVVTHQRNQLRKEELRRQTDAYDAEIKRKIRQVADTRKELANIPAYNAADGPTREIDVEELLRYAEFISKTTVPPTLSKPTAPAVKKEEAKPAQLTNGTATPPPDTQSQEQNGVAVAEGGATEDKYLTEKYRSWVRWQPQFRPWPMHDTMQLGALAAIQRLVEAGQDPGSVLSAEEKAEVERARAEEEERERVEVEERQRRWNAGGGARRRETVEEAFNPDDI